jgi:hypothetical protein
MSVSPVYFHRSVTIDRIGLEVTTAAEAASTLRLGVYSDNGNLYPGLLIADCGTVASDSLGVKEITLSDLVIPAGVVWVGAAFQGQPAARANVRTISGAPPCAGVSASAGVSATNTGYLNAVGPGALPSNWSSAGSLQRISLVPRIFWRIKP